MNSSYNFEDRASVAESDNAQYVRDDVLLKSRVGCIERGQFWKKL